MKYSPDKSIDCGSVNRDSGLTLPVDASAQKASTAHLAEIGRRMRVAREAAGLSQRQMAEEIGGKERGLQDNERGLRHPREKVLSAFERKGIRRAWILTGEGPMLVTGDVAPALSAAPATPDVAIATPNVAPLQVAPEQLHGQPSPAQVDAAALANLVRAAQAAADPGTPLDDVAENAVSLYNQLFSRKNGKVNPGALTAVLFGALELNPSIDDAVRSAVQFYQQMLQTRMITPDDVGDGGAKSA